MEKSTPAWKKYTNAVGGVADKYQVCAIYENTFSNQLPSECRASAARSDIPAIYFFGFTELSAAMLVVWRCWLWNINLILFWSLTLIREEESKSNCCYYFNRPFFVFSPCVGIYTEILMFWSEPPECIQYIAIHVLSCRVHPIYCDIFCPAERLRYMTCRLTSDISTKEFHH